MRANVCVGQTTLNNQFGTSHDFLHVWMSFPIYTGKFSPRLSLSYISAFQQLSGHFRLNTSPTSPNQNFHSRFFLPLLSNLILSQWFFFLINSITLPPEQTLLNSVFLLFSISLFPLPPTSCGVCGSVGSNNDENQIIQYFRIYMVLFYI